MNNKEQLQRIQGAMVFLAAGANGLEVLLGRGAASITFRAGRMTGLKADVERTEQDIFKALDGVWDEMCKIGMRWPFEPYKKETATQLITTDHDGNQRMQLVFRNCMVRSALFRYGHPQKLSLCHMNHGLFCGLLEKICGSRCNLEIDHAGENACLKTLTIFAGKSSK